VLLSLSPLFVVVIVLGFKTISYQLFYNYSTRKIHRSIVPPSSYFKTTRFFRGSISLSRKMSSNSKSVEEGVISIHWFRKGLRLHDNPSLVEAAKNAAKVYPVFCLDPYFAKPDTVGINRYNFLLESLSDLDSSLRKLGSRLFILQGKPEEKLIQAIQEWNVTKITFEADTEPYANSRDARIRELLKPRSIEVSTFPSHTLNDMERYVALAKGAKVSTYQGFQKLFDSLGKTKVRQAISSPDCLPPISSEEAADSRYDIPTLAALDYNDRHEVTTPFRGGETEALHRLTRYVIERRKWVLEFEKPLTSPNSLEPSTTVLSPYLKFGCLSVTKFFNELDSIYSSMG
jgi:cryptochrome